MGEEQVARKEHWLVPSSDKDYDKAVECYGLRRW